MQATILIEELLDNIHTKDELFFLRDLLDSLPKQDRKKTSSFYSLPAELARTVQKAWLEYRKVNPQAPLDEFIQWLRSQLDKVKRLELTLNYHPSLAQAKELCQELRSKLHEHVFVISISQDPEIGLGCQLGYEGKQVTLTTSE